MDGIIRKLKPEETKVLDTFLYEAIFVPEGAEAPPRDIINRPELQVRNPNFARDKAEYLAKWLRLQP